MFWRVSGHAHHGHHPHPLRRHALIAVLVAALLAAIALLLLPPKANGNFVYWANDGPARFDRAREDQRHRGEQQPSSRGIERPTSGCGGLQVHLLDRTARRPASAARTSTAAASTPTSSPPASTTRRGSPSPRTTASTGRTRPGSPDSIGHANIDGSNPVANFVTTTSTNICGRRRRPELRLLAAQRVEPGRAIGKAPLSGGDRRLGVHQRTRRRTRAGGRPSFLYWTDRNHRDRTAAPIGGGGRPGQLHRERVDKSRRAARRRGQLAIRLLVGCRHTRAIGRANINGSAINPALAPGSTNRPDCSPPRPRTR